MYLLQYDEYIEGKCDGIQRNMLFCIKIRWSIGFGTLPNKASETKREKRDEEMVPLPK